MKLKIKKKREKTEETCIAEHRTDELLIRGVAGQGICDVFEQHKNICVVS